MRRSTGLLLAALFSPTVLAGLFDEPQNLQVLPEEISAAELRATMRGFSLATGLRCNGCHVGEGDDFSTFDFPADDKDTKKAARLMLRMQRDINARLGQELGNGSAVQVECETCHRGQSRPRMLDDLLVDTFASEGLEATVTQYRELRAQYYGGHTFDFGESSLIDAALALAGNPEQVPAALALLDLNLEFNPDSMMSMARQGQLHAMAGDRDAAIARLEQALALSPDNAWLQGLLARARQPTP